MIFFSVILLIPIIFLPANADLIPIQTKKILVSFADEESHGKEILSSLYQLEKNNLITLKSNIPQTYILPEKGETVFVKISGNTMDYQKRAPVFLTITSPDGSKSEISVQTVETGTYYTNLILTHESSVGLYSITGTYQKNPILPVFFTVKNSSDIIPKWFSQVAKWLVDDKISDSEFIFSLQYLVDHDIIQVSSSINESNLQVKVIGEKFIRRGITQEITLVVSDGPNPIEGARVFVRVEDFGENILKEFTGFTDASGRYIFSWEIPTNAKQEKLLSFIDVTDGIKSKSIVFSFDVICLCGEADCKCRN